ncbi:hypothetical protein Q8A73_013271 [Channa argus]|nr:hypothetical protein Q8A73_013271 [Channa argus]
MSKGRLRYLGETLNVFGSRLAQGFSLARLLHTSALELLHRFSSHLRGYVLHFRSRHFVLSTSQFVAQVISLFLTLKRIIFLCWLRNSHGMRTVLNGFEPRAL